MKKFTKTNLKEMKKEVGMNRVERKVISNLLSKGLSTSDLLMHMTEVTNYGCCIAYEDIIKHYIDTVKFFDTYRTEITEMIEECFNRLGAWEYDEEGRAYTKLRESMYYKGQKKFSCELKDILACYIYAQVCSDILDYFFES